MHKSHIASILTLLVVLATAAAATATVTGLYVDRIGSDDSVETVIAEAVVEVIAPVQAATTTTIPEPATLVLLGMGLSGFALRKRGLRP